MRNEGGAAKYFCAMSPEEFGNRVRCIEDMPYIPQNNLSEIAVGLQAYITANDAAGFVGCAEKWLKKAYIYTHEQYNPNEADAINAIIKEKWQTFRNAGIKTDEDTELDAQILEEDYSL